jgi:hypothetical protein
MDDINQEQPTSNPDKNEELEVKKPSKWRYFFIFLGAVQLLGVALFLLIITQAIQDANAGVSGTEFIALILYVTLVPVIGIVAFINLIGLPIYLVKNRPSSKGLIYSVLSIIFSLILTLYGAYNFYELRIALPAQEKKHSEIYKKESEARDKQFAEDNAKPEITKEEAISLLKNCKLKGFYYTHQTSKDNGGWGELSSTGVVLTKIDGMPYRISIADRLIPDLVPIAREAQKTCGGPQFWHNGSYEQKQPDGTWQ